MAFLLDCKLGAWVKSRRKLGLGSGHCTVVAIGRNIEQIEGRARRLVFNHLLVGPGCPWKIIVL